MKYLKIQRSQIGKTAFLFRRSHHVELLIAVMLLIATAPAGLIEAQAQSWSQVAPIYGAVESPATFRSGIVTDIDASGVGSIAVTTAWGGYFVGNSRFISRTDTLPTGRMQSLARYPADGSKVVVATGSTPSLGSDDWGLGLFYTPDGGINWQSAVPAGHFTGGWRFEKVRWGASSFVFAASNRGLYRSTDYGTPGSWFIVFRGSHGASTKSQLFSQYGCVGYRGGS
jgi:hypothetical protein